MLRAIGAALGPRGTWLRNPAPGRRAWRNGGRGRRSAVTFPAADWSSGVSRSPPWTFRSSVRHTYTFVADGAVITSDSTPRFRGTRRGGIEPGRPGRPGAWTCGDALDRRAASSCSSPSGPSDGDLDRCVRGRDRAAVGPDQDVVGPAGRPGRSGPPNWWSASRGRRLAVQVDRLDGVAGDGLAVDGDRVPGDGQAHRADREPGRRRVRLAPPGFR